MALADFLGLHFRLREALAIGVVIAFLATVVITPRAIRKLRGAGIVGQDKNKPGQPPTPEMGGLAVFLAFNMGAFAALALGDLAEADQVVTLASLVVIAGAALTGALDDLIALRQRFKAVIPFAFAAPLALYVDHSDVVLPVVGSVEFGIAYPLLLVPLGVACASNGFNMLEGFNGLGTGLGIISAVALSAMALLQDEMAGLVLLAPLTGALLGFWVFNAYPARIFPGDTFTLTVGAIIACAAILSKLEFWGALLLLPHMVEFALKAKGRFEAHVFASRVEDGRLYYEGPTESLTHLVMKAFPGSREARVTTLLLLGHTALALLVVAWFVSGLR